MKEQVVRQHTSFIKFLYASLIIAPEAQNVVEDMALFKYRHMCWAMADSKRAGEEFDGQFNVEEVEQLKKLKTQRELVDYLIADLEANLKTYTEETPTITRFKTDDSYFLSQLRKLKVEGKITAFSGNGELEGVELTEENKNALIFFLMEEIFKEYELILIYSFYKTYSANAIANSVFTDLAYDSIYHLKRFGELARELGVLTLPRVVPLEKYRNEPIIQFLKENIEEERDAEKNCLILAEKIGNPELKEFLLFISRQEVYHAELLQRALETLQ
jgi:rubrerythrin